VSSIDEHFAVHVWASGVHLGKSHPANRPKRLVWRISESAPLGQGVEPDAGGPGRPDSFALEGAHGSWITSSFDLVQGTDVSEAPIGLSDAPFDGMVASWKRRDTNSSGRP
jgi:hypothetical protein